VENDVLPDGAPDEAVDVDDDASNDASNDAPTRYNFGDHRLTNEAREAGRERQRIAVSGPRFSATLTRMLEGKANLDVAQEAAVSTEIWKLTEAVLGRRLRETDPASGETPHCTWAELICARVIARANVDDKAASLVMDRIEGKPSQEVKSQGTINIEFAIPPDMQQMIDRARERALENAATVDADFEKVTD